MKYDITIFDEKMRCLTSINKTRGFVKCIKNGLLKRSKRAFGNYTLELKNTIIENKEYTTEINGKKYYIWLGLTKTKNVGGR